MDIEQRAVYDARLNEIREANKNRTALENKTEPVLSEAALLSLAIYSAIEGAS